MKINRPTTVQLIGRGNLKLAPANHLATGGEGTIYRVGTTVIKLYLDPDQMARDGIADKIVTLSRLKHPYVVAPRGVVATSQGRPIGWYMDYVDGEPLARAFTNDWRQRQSFGDPETATLIERMRQVVEFAHQQQALMVDANELNWLVVVSPKTAPQPRILDVDSWSIGRWPPRVIMPSIRDWHTKGHTPGSDWFAWAVVTFQLYTGIHPYKGGLDGYKPGDLMRRMQDNASVFTPGIRLNRAVRDFNRIPGPLLDWYKAVFTGLCRDNPPSPRQAPAPVSVPRRLVPAKVDAGVALKYQELYRGSSDPAVRVFPCGVVLLDSGGLYDLDTNRHIGHSPSPDIEVVSVETGWLVASINDALVGAQYIGRDHSSTVMPGRIAGRRLVRSSNRLFAVTVQGLTELNLMHLVRPQLVAGQTWGALPATKWFDGLGVQDTMGSSHLIIPFGDDSCAHVRTPELDGLPVISASGGARFAAVIALDRQGVYRKFEFSFDRQYRHYSLWTGTSEGPELNTAVLPRGVVTTIAADGELVIYVPSSGDLRRVSDQSVTTAIRLFSWGDLVVGVRDGHVLRLQLRS